ncbi:hypothetical protein [Peribacillus glennii]|uniref:Uncharacterized protein n=1 Tax=Peribacillus glennii TaxID=2303991 RepID=A0A372LGZ7_9BACI|nr:hypothetical protein [Peribacillus glennii]RFU65567.1 hypothetical protein D0466_06720 [Peribacillus glennii]
MLQKISRLIIGTLCGYLYIIWAPVTYPFELSRFFAVLIVDPIKFFAATVAFITGFLNFAGLIKSNVELLLNWHLSDTNKMEWMLACFIPISFYLLSLMNTALSAIFFIFACAYGIISVEKPGKGMRG